MSAFAFCTVSVSLRIMPDGSAEQRLQLSTAPVPDVVWPRSLQKQHDGSPISVTFAECTEGNEYQKWETTGK